jgi:molybdopterin converting factor small subunit
VTVLFYGSVLEHTNKERSFESKDSMNIRELIDELGGHFGERFRKFLLGGGSCFFLVNGTGITATGGLETRLNQGDKIEVLPSIDAG